MVCMFNAGIISLTNGYVTWKIYDFYSLSITVGTELRSPEFEYDDSRYILVIWPRGRKGSDSEEWFGIYLYKYNAPANGSSVQFSIVNSLGAVKTCTVECSGKNLFWQERFIKWPEFRALSHKISPDRCLTIVCRLPKQHSGGKCVQNDNMTSVFSRPTSDPPVNYQSGNYQSPDFLSEVLSYKLGSPETQISTYACLKELTSSATNATFSTSSVENSLENITGADIQNSDPNMPYSAMRTTSGSPSFWRNFTRGFFRASKRDQSDTELDPAEDVSGSFSDSAITSPKTINSQENSNSSRTTLSDSASSGSKHVVEEIDSQKAPQSCSIPEVSSFVLSSKDHCTSSGRFEQMSVASDPQKEHLSPPHPYPKGLKLLSQHFKNLYLEGKNFDLTIIMEGKEFKVHKSVLVTRSPVFDELFSQNIDQNTSNVITIDPFDACDSSVFHDFLIYVYSGEIDDFPHKNIYGLFSAAHKFELPDLKEECLNCLKSSLSIDTITGVFRLIKKECDLLDMAVVFLARNMEVIMNTDEWKQFMRDEPDRAVEYHLKALKIGYMKTINA